ESMGGIPLIEYRYSKQLDWKRNKVETDLEKIAKITDVKINETIGMEYPFRYRNHVQIPVGNEEGKTVTGFYQLNTNYIIDMEESILQAEIGNKILSIIKTWIEEYNIPSYDKDKQEG